MNIFRFTPRDPTVLGDGRPLERQSAQVWPIPATLTAAINRWAYDASEHRDRNKLQLMSSSVRGPLLLRDGQLYVPPPADARLRAEGEDRPLWVKGALLPGDGVLWPEGFSALPKVYHLDERAKNGDKRPPIEGAVGLDDAITWALGQRSPSAGGKRLWRDEDRMHVALQSGTGTALDGALFRSAGVRLDDSVGWVFTWDGAPLVRSSESLVPFGGEGRQGWLEALDGSVFPDFTRWERAFSQTKDERAWLRVQLLTPGLFEGDVPAAPAWLLQRADRGCGQPLSLVAMTSGRYRAFSGWKQSRNVNEPRAVRRCVPAGAVYWLGDAHGEPLERDDLEKAARALWLQPFDSPDLPASRQGFGLALPGFTPFENPHEDAR